jgi:glycosyltransferase involved in cell wall biosynthesis
MSTLSKARFLVMASRVEGRSIATLEAVTRGVPVVVDDVKKYSYLNQMADGVTACATLDGLQTLSSRGEIADAARAYNQRARERFLNVVYGGG